MILEFLFWALISGTWGFYFCAVLTNSGEIFDFIPPTIRYVTTGSKKIIPAPNKFIASIWKITFECPKCHAAWIGAFVYLFIYGCLSFQFFIAFVLLASFTAFNLTQIFK